jgi:signal transduction histidine kinase
MSTRTRTSSVPICCSTRVNIAIDESHACITYSVAEDGSGVAQEDVAIAFKRHFTLDNNADETRLGNGIRELNQLLTEVAAASIANNSQRGVHGLKENFG